MTHDRVFFVCYTELLVKVFFVCYSQLVTRYLLYATLDIGEEVIDIDTPPKKKQHATDQAAAYFLTNTLKGYRVYHYSKGSKNCIDVVFHEGGIPSERTHPMMSLDQGGKALKVKWKLSKRLFMDKQATAQAIPKDSAWYNRYADAPDHIHQAGVMPIDKFYQGAPQRIALDRECTGNPVTNHWCVLTNKVVHYEGRCCHMGTVGSTGCSGTLGPGFKPLRC